MVEHALSPSLPALHQVLAVSPVPALPGDPRPYSEAGPLTGIPCPPKSGHNLLAGEGIPFQPPPPLDVLLPACVYHARAAVLPSTPEQGSPRVDHVMI